jgi:hypothetical protein
MAIQEITDIEVVQRCAVCDRENRVALAKLRVGVEREAQVEDSVIALPECPRCHAQEFLVRSAAKELPHPTQGSAGHLHRLMVDELHAQLVYKGLVVERLVGKADQVVAKPISTEVRARFFNDGLKLSARAVEQLQGKEPQQ